MADEFVTMRSIDAFERMVWHRIEITEAETWHQRPRFVTIYGHASYESDLFAIIREKYPTSKMTFYTYVGRLTIAELMELFELHRN